MELTITSLIGILFTGILVNNYVLTHFLGLCPFMGVSNQIDTAISMSFATTFVLTLSSGLSFLAYHYLLEPLGIPFLKTLTFILTIAITVQLTELVIQQTSPMVNQVLGLYLPLITSNCAVLGIALLNVQNQVDSLFIALINGFAAAIGFSLVMILFAAIREKLAHADIPHAFKGAPIGFITAGLMALAFSGFTGLTTG